MASVHWVGTGAFYIHTNVAMSPRRFLSHAIQFTRFSFSFSACSLRRILVNDDLHQRQMGPTLVAGRFTFLFRLVAPPPTFSCFSLRSLEITSLEERFSFDPRAPLPGF